MNYETEAIRPRQVSTRSLDGFDRKILAVLVKDARLPYAEIGNLVGLSAPAVHDRVRKLRESGVLKGVHAYLHGPAIGKPLLAYVHVDADGWGKSQRMMRLQEFPEVEEMHSVAGDTCMVLKVRTADAQALENLLLQIYILPGVKGTKSYIVLSTYLERPIQADFTDPWPVVPMPKD